MCSSVLFPTFLKNHFLYQLIYIKIWDRRCLNETNPKEVGVFSGHLDGITYIDSKNDSRYLISNSKDQTIKLWDMRVFSPSGDTNQASSRRRTRYHNRWDYRWDTVPKECNYCPRTSSLSVFANIHHLLKCSNNFWFCSLYGHSDAIRRFKHYDIPWPSRQENIN